VTRRFRDGHTETWWAADARLGSWGPDRQVRLVVATTGPARLPKHTTWYLVTNRPHPEHAGQSGLPPADLAEIVRCYGLRNWAEQGYKQVKHELGWADFQVRGATAIQRHHILVCCAFSFCWQAGAIGVPHPEPPQTATTTGQRRRRAGRPERGNHPTVHIGQNGAALAGRATPDPGLVDPGHTAATLLAGMVERAPTAPTARPTHRRPHRPSDQPLPPALTNHR
jgi:hypothetical protein